MSKLFRTIDMSVYPSDQKTVYVKYDDLYEGAHNYFITKTLGFHNGETNYVFDEQEIQFVKKDDNGDITPGIQNEQLIIMLLDRDEKLNNRFPHETYEEKKACLIRYLELCKNRIDDRIQRNVMGDLKK